MKFSSIKFGVAVGSALSILFLLGNIFFYLTGKDAALWVMTVLFYEVDFKSLMLENDHSIVHLFCGVGITFIVGFCIGFITAIIYNSISKVKVKIIEKPVVIAIKKDDAPKEEDERTPIGFNH